MQKESFGEYLKRKRKERKITLKQLASETQLSHAYLSQIENGLRGVPNINNLYKISFSLGMENPIELLTVAELFDEIKEYQLQGLADCFKEHIGSYRSLDYTTLRTIEINSNDVLKLFNKQHQETENNAEHGKEINYDDASDVYKLTLLAFRSFPLKDVKRREKFISFIFRQVEQGELLHTAKEHLRNGLDFVLTDTLFTNDFFCSSFIKKTTEHLINNKESLGFQGDADFKSAIATLNYERKGSFIYGLCNLCEEFYDSDVVDSYIEFIKETINATSQEVQFHASERIDLKILSDMPNVHYGGKKLSKQELQKVQEVMKLFFTE